MIVYGNLLEAIGFVLLLAVFFALLRVTSRSWSAMARFFGDHRSLGRRLDEPSGATRYSLVKVSPGLNYHAIPSFGISSSGIALELSKNG